MSAYYNENDPFTATWLRELIRAGLVASGEVDQRSIEDVRPGDLRGFTQCHFFAGIGGWSYALRIAGWPDDRPVWTGSCPCQPFSQAGKGEGFADERHLWPAWHWLIQQCRPAIVFGEQVARGGMEWLDLVSSDLEGADYAFGAAVIPACSVGAPHIRERSFWVGVSNGNGWQERFTSATTMGQRDSVISTGGFGGIGMGDASAPGLPVREFTELPGQGRRVQGGTVDSFWSDADWIWCRDRKWRSIEPESFPLAHGVPNRVGLLRGYGNAIVPQVAARFIRSMM